MTMITPSYLGETIEYSSLHACRSTLEDPTTPCGTRTMSTFETSATVGEQGRVLVAGVPFAPGTEVEVTISSKRRSAEDFAAAWRRVSAELRSRPGVQNLAEEDIRKEIDRYRAGQ